MTFSIELRLLSHTQTLSETQTEQGSTLGIKSSSILNGSLLLLLRLLLPFPHSLALLLLLLLLVLLCYYYYIFLRNTKKMKEKMMQFSSTPFFSLFFFNPFPFSPSSSSFFTKLFIYLIKLEKKENVKRVVLLISFCLRARHGTERNGRAMEGICRFSHDSI